MGSSYDPSFGVLLGPQLDKQRWWARLGILRVNCRHFKTTWRSHLQRTGLKVEPLSSPETSITANLHCVTSQKSGDVIYATAETCNHATQMFITVFTKCLQLGLSLCWLYPVHICTLKNKIYSCSCVCHDGVGGSGGVTPLILIHGARWKTVVKFTFCSLYHLQRIPW